MTRGMLPMFLVIGVLDSCASMDQASQTTPPGQERYVIVTADDFGAAENINEGIEFASARGAITTVSALMNFPFSFSRLQQLADRHPRLGIGVHLNLTTGKPLLDSRQVPTLVDANGDFFTVDGLYARIGTISLAELEQELRAQINALKDLNIRPDHLSDHNGVLSLYPPFFDVFARLALEFGLPVRSPLSVSMKYPLLFPDAGIRKKGRDVAWRVAGRGLFNAIGLLRYTNVAQIEERVKLLDALDIPHPDILVDYLYGNPTVSNALHVLRNIPARISEIVVHLGTSRRSESYPVGLDTGYFDNREQELVVVTSTYLAEFAKTLGIVPVGFDDLASLRGGHHAP